MSIVAEKKEKRYVSDNAQLMDEWDWEKNNALGLDPSRLTYGSGKKAWWLCSKGHSWATSVYHRSSRNSGCPYCSNKKILPGYNDLQSQRPLLMAEWDFEKNTIQPSSVAVMSNKIAYWVCPKGHKYTKAICQRVSGSDCPICNRARRTSFPEQCFFYYIKELYPDAINSYKDVFDNGMELDIYIPAIKTGIEYDGVYWHDKTSLSKEERKYRICRKNGIRLLRIKEGEFADFSFAADRVWYIPKKSTYHQLNLYITDVLKFLTFFSKKLPVVNVAKDKNKILEYKTLKLEVSLLYLFPNIAKEWHPYLNGKLTPDLFTPGSAEKVWWLCSNCGNEWESSIVNRTKGHGCDICATQRRKATKKNTLLTVRGSIDKEWCLLDWDYENNEYGPEYYTNGSGEKVSWRCHKCGHKWMAIICDRTRESRNGCPLCSSKTIVSGVNDLKTLKPDLMRDWDYKANTLIDPTTVGRGSHLTASWKCHICGFEWTAQIYNRANGKGCPYCAKKLSSEKKKEQAILRSGTLAEKNPNLAKEWHPLKNGEQTPEMITSGSDQKAWWLCRKCGHEWKASVGSRHRGAGCPVCAREKHKKSK